MVCSFSPPCKAARKNRRGCSLEVHKRASADGATKRVFFFLFRWKTRNKRGLRTRNRARSPPFLAREHEHNPEGRHDLSQPGLGHKIAPHPAAVCTSRQLFSRASAGGAVYVRGVSSSGWIYLHPSLFYPPTVYWGCGRGLLRTKQARQIMILTGAPHQSVPVYTIRCR